MTNPSALSPLYPIEEQEMNQEELVVDQDEQEVEDDPLMMFDGQQALVEMLDRARQDHLQQLSQQILTQQPNNDTTVRDFLSQWNFAPVPKNTTTNAAAPSIHSDHSDQQQQYPPLVQSGIVAEHHRPYAAYGHLDRATIAKEFQFNLERPSMAQRSIRLNAKSFAITSWTDVSKDIVMNHIKSEFGLGNIQYICISEEISELNHQRHLHIQIILKEKVDRRKPFLDDITNTRCNYQVTRNDLAWNEYIKKESNYIEFNDFKSTRTRGQKTWPSTESSSSSSSSISDVSKTTSVQPKTTTVRAQNEARRQFEQETVNKALELAKTNVHQAMDLMRQALPSKFLSHSSWYLTTFNYIHLRQQEEIDRTGKIDKEYVWPLSFPQCTDRLRKAMNRWIRHHFSRTKRAKCLILIGPSGVGKTSFALSLPGRVNYFKERWNLDHWSDFARYSVYDDIPWDDFSKLNYPNKKGLLTQNGRMNATDKYRGTKEINVRQPAIVLLNPEDAGSLLTEPVTVQQQQTADYWKERAFIYIMSEGEYFYQRPISKQHQPRTTIEALNLSGQSSMGNDEVRLGDIDEFDRMIDEYQKKHRKS